MFWFVVGILFLLAAVVVQAAGRNLIYNVALRVGAVGLALILGIVLLVFSGALWVGDGKGGLVTQKFGPGLKDGHIIADNGERGVQAEVLSQGWSFWYAPWKYDLESVPNVVIPPGSVGVVTALDGAPLPAGEVYASAWESPTLMLDAHTFLSKGGCKGPQLTVLPPGQYRYNPRLFVIAAAPCVDIPIGFAGAVRANAGPYYGGTNVEIEAVNGVPLVPSGFRGVWTTPLMPGQYYMHPSAYQVITAKAMKRVYSYTGATGSEANTANKKEPDGDNSIHVQTLDGFRFPVDVRVAVNIQAQNLPYIVAKLGDPDGDTDHNGFDNLEEMAILPSIRAILRNSAEKQRAIEYVNSRSLVEVSSKILFEADMKKDKIDVEGLYLADIGINRTPEGVALLKTQTDKEIATQQQTMYQKQVLAETDRSKQVEARAAADMQEQIQKSKAGIKVAEQDAEAAKLRAQGEAAQSLVYKAKIDALGGPDAFTRFEVTKLMVESVSKALTEWKPDLPKILIMGDKGGSGGSVDAMLASLLAQMSSVSLDKAPAVAPATK